MTKERWWKLGAAVVVFVAIAGICQRHLLFLLEHLYGFDEMVTFVREYDGTTATPAPVLFFGDSTLKIYGPSDTDTRNIGELLAARRPEMRVRVLAFPTWTARMYELFVDLLRDMKHRPRRVIVPVNLRSFHPLWTESPLTSLAEHHLFLRAYREPFVPLKILHSFQHFRSRLTTDEYQRMPLIHGGQKIGNVQDFQRVLFQPSLSPEDIALLFRSQYGDRLDPGHENALALGRMLRQLVVLGVTPVVYVTPVNGEVARPALGDGFAEGVRRDVEVVRRICREAGTELLDLSSSLGAAEFADRRDHLFQGGRAQVAAALEAFMHRPDRRATLPP